MNDTASQPYRFDVNCGQDDAAFKTATPARRWMAGRMKPMRRLMIAGLLVLFGLCGSAEAQTSPPSAAALATIQAIIAQYPNGGAGLQQAIAAAVEADPTLALAAVQLARTATPDQQEEVGLGLAEAAAKLQATGTPAGIAAAQQIQQIVSGGPPLLIVAFTLAGGTTGTPVLTGIGIGPSLRTSRGIIALVLAVTNSSPPVVGGSPKCISPAVPGVNCNP